MANETTRKTWVREGIITMAASVLTLLVQSKLGLTGRAPLASPPQELPAASRAARADSLRYFERAAEFARKGQHREAAEHYTEALRLDPSSAAAYAGRGWARGRLGQYEQTIQDCTEALRLEPACVPAYVNRAWALGQLRQYEQAIKDCTEAIRLEPGQAEAYRIRSWACAQTPAPAVRGR